MRRVGYPISGVRLLAKGQVWPAAWDVGGLWFAFLDRSNTLSFTYARSVRAFYFRAGFAF